MSHYFLSDIHLKPYNDPRAEILSRFLLSLIGKAQSVFLMGDIFDFWMGGHQVWMERYPVFVESIRRLKDAGIRVVFFEGNHDIHVHPFYRDQLKCEIYTNPQVMELSGYKVRLEHGDLFNPDDKSYFFLRDLLRSKPIEWLSIHAPGALVASIADWGSKTSHKRSSRLARLPSVIEDIKRRTQIYFEKCARETDFDIMIMGHTHIADDFEMSFNSKKVRFVNLGSWFVEHPKVFCIESKVCKFIDVKTTGDI